MGLKMALGLYIKRFNETFDLYSINVFCPVQDCEIQHNQAEVFNWKEKLRTVTKNLTLVTSQAE